MSDPSSAESTTKPKKRLGRPPGRKNRPKDPELPSTPAPKAKKIATPPVLDKRTRAYQRQTSDYARTLKPEQPPQPSPSTPVSSPAQAAGPSSQRPPTPAEAIEQSLAAQATTHTLKPQQKVPSLRNAVPHTALGLASFYQWMYSDRGFQVPAHLAFPIMALADKRINKLLLIIGPGSGKSALLSTVFPAFSLGQDPSMTILGISAGEALMQGFMSGIMEWIEHSPLWKAIFPDVVPDKDKGWSTERGMFVKGHRPGDPDASFFPTGLTSKALTGKHARLIIGDDIHDKENSASTDACLRVRETFYRQILGRADPGGARYIFAGRRWHEEDLYGHLKSTGEWVVMELPAIREGVTELYWDITIPHGLVCCFNEHLQDQNAQAAAR